MRARVRSFWSSVSFCSWGRYTSASWPVSGCGFGATFERSEKGRILPTTVQPSTRSSRSWEGMSRSPRRHSALSRWLSTRYFSSPESTSSSQLYCSSGSIIFTVSLRLRRLLARERELTPIFALRGSAFGVALRTIPSCSVGTSFHPSSV
ncbi:hypothetical protein DFP72DRAFT_918761 [Ephemerocybe angulata]|uniref:Uncharacterized protein n=1 Tax=Ephemerocybe angulata TaxID=980116 RepID=A0A8H6HJX2_9AGAR|nr:hypothetical protein DFP72DRAFT_918761 [Tulosesus angulatus]